MMIWRSPFHSHHVRKLKVFVESMNRVVFHENVWIVNNLKHWLIVTGKSFLWLGEREIFFINGFSLISTLSQMMTLMMFVIFVWHRCDHYCVEYVAKNRIWIWISYLTPFDIVSFEGLFTPKYMYHTKNKCPHFRYKPPADFGDFEEAETKYWRNIVFNSPISGADVLDSLMESNQVMIKEIETLIFCRFFLFSILLW